MPVMDTNKAKPVRPARCEKLANSRGRCEKRDVYSQGPTFHFAWKLATLAKQAMARKLKKACEVWKMMAGFEMIIYKNGVNRVAMNRG